MVRVVQPRPHLSEEPTDSELATVFGPYVSQAGEYEVNGTTLTFRPMVAKDPANMAPGMTQTWEITELTDTVLEYTGTPGGASIRVTFTRVE